jgi:hypothetical protein
MKRIIAVIILCLLAYAGFSQPVQNRSGSMVTVQDSRWMAALNATMPRYADTAAALSGTNEGLDSAGSIIYTHDVGGLWYRLFYPKKWVQISGSSGAINIYNSDGTLTGTRTVTLGGYNLRLTGSSTSSAFLADGDFVLGGTSKIGSYGSNRAMEIQSSASAFIGMIGGISGSNASTLYFSVNPATSTTGIVSGIRGSGTPYPFTINTGALQTERFRIDTAGDIDIQKNLYFPNYSWIDVSAIGFDILDTANNFTSGRVGVYPSNAAIGYQSGGAMVNQLQVLRDSMRVIDGFNQKGLVYAGDYEANFTPRSLVTKQYVTSVLPTTPTLQQVLTAGSSLTGANSIVTSGSLDISSNTGGRLMIYPSVATIGYQAGGVLKRYIQFGQSAMTVVDDSSSRGLINSGDYEANFTARSLVTKKYVASQLATQGLQEVTNVDSVTTREIIAARFTVDTVGGMAYTSPWRADSLNKFNINGVSHWYGTTNSSGIGGLDFTFLKQRPNGDSLRAGDEIQYFEFRGKHHSRAGTGWMLSDSSKLMDDKIIMGYHSNGTATAKRFFRWNDNAGTMAPAITLDGENSRVGFKTAIPNYPFDFADTANFQYDIYSQKRLMLSGSTAFANVPSGQAHVYRNSVIGLVMAGNGSTYDLSLLSKNGGSVMLVPTGTNNTEFYGNALFSGTTVTASSFIKSGGTSSQFLMADGSVSTQTTSSGTYTPTVTDIANTTSNVARVCQYLRVGNTVTVSGFIDLTVTAGATSTIVEISLPIASNFSAVENCAGGGTAGTATLTSVYGSVTNDKATVFFVSSGTGSTAVAFQFTYTII